MKLNNQKLGGTLIFIGSCQWLLITIILESLQPYYIGSIHYVSSLGVGPTALIFNLSLILFGGFIMASCLSVHHQFNFKIFTICFFITGLFITGVGIFPESLQPWHGIFTGFSFIFAGLDAIISYKILKPPISQISVILGIITLASAIFFYPYLGLPKESTLTFLGLFKGTMERIVIYPVFFWIISFSIYLTFHSEK